MHGPARIRTINTQTSDERQRGKITDHQQETQCSGDQVKGWKMQVGFNLWLGQNNRNSTIGLNDQIKCQPWGKTTQYIEVKQARIGYFTTQQLGFSRFDPSLGWKTIHFECSSSKTKKNSQIDMLKYRYHTHEYFMNIVQRDHIYQAMTYIMA